MNKIYIVQAQGGEYEESYTCIIKVCSTREKAEAYIRQFLNSPELQEGYEDLYDIYIIEWDVD